MCTSESQRKMAEEDERFKQIIDTVTLKIGPPNVNFRTGSQSFLVHKEGLEKYSPVLKAQLSDVWHSSGDSIQLDEEYVEPEVVEELLIYIYYLFEKHPLQCSEENAYSLCIAAHYLMIPELLKHCSTLLESTLSVENFYDFYKLSLHLNFRSFQWDCVNFLFINKNSVAFFESPEVVKVSLEDLLWLIKKVLVHCNYFSDIDTKASQVRQAILYSLFTWIDGSIDRSGELEKLLECLRPQTLSSDCLFRFMKTEFYSRLDESHRKQYSVRQYNFPKIDLTDKLYCFARFPNDKIIDVDEIVFCDDIRSNCIAYTPIELPDICSGVKGNKYGLEGVPYEVWLSQAIGISSGRLVYFIVCNEYGYCTVEIFDTETNKWSHSGVRDKHYDGQMIAGAEMDGYLYVTDRPVSRTSALIHLAKRLRISRFCLTFNKWEAVRWMQVDRQDHQLVGLKGYLYAIGGAVCEVDGQTSGQELGSKQVADTEQECVEKQQSRRNRTERYCPRTDRWYDIAPTNYDHNSNPIAVAHNELIYVLSKAGFETYSPETDQWTKLPQPGDHYGRSLVSFNRKLWMIGSFYRDREVASRPVYEFDVDTKEWSRLPDLPEQSFSDCSFVIKQ